MSKEYQVKMDDRYITLPDLPDGYQINIKDKYGHIIHSVSYPINRPCTMNYFPIPSTDTHPVTGEELDNE